jgi:exosome complex RNA-binding protein Rrp42 (RNase PH superfamily)
MDTIDQTKKVYVVEGQIDSIFIDNCVAAASSALDSTIIPKNKAILIPDKDVRNKEIMKLVDKWIKNGYTICMLNENFPYKDINDAIIDGMTKEELMCIIENNTFSGLKAKMMFTKWSKV